jgi:hypothetical protein
MLFDLFNNLSGGIGANNKIKNCNFHSKFFDFLLKHLTVCSAIKLIVHLTMPFMFKSHLHLLESYVNIFFSRQAGQLELLLEEALEVAADLLHENRLVRRAAVRFGEERE